MKKIIIAAAVVFAISCQDNNPNNKTPDDISNADMNSLNKDDAKADTNKAMKNLPSDTSTKR